MRRRRRSEPSLLYCPQQRFANLIRVACSEATNSTNGYSAFFGKNFHLKPPHCVAYFELGQTLKAGKDAFLAKEFNSKFVSQQGAKTLTLVSPASVHSAAILWMAFSPRTPNHLGNPRISSNRINQTPATPPALYPNKDKNQRAMFCAKRFQFPGSSTNSATEILRILGVFLTQKNSQNR